MSQFGWDLVGRVLQEEKPKGNWYYLKHAYLGYQYATDPLTRVMWDVRIAQSRFPSRGSGGPSVAAPTSTDASKRSESGRTSSAAGNSAHGFRKRKGVSARGKCPKGHYWSYKKKKCVKSKFK